MKAHLEVPKCGSSAGTETESTSCGSRAAAPSPSVSEKVDELCNRPRRRCATHKEDLVWRFACMINSTSTAHSDGEVTTANLEEDLLARKVLQSVRLMRSCKYEMDEIAAVLAYASVYFTHIFAQLGDKLGSSESVYICILLVYLAHCHLLDETCPLHIWQKYIFKKYSSIKTLNAALFRIFKLRDFRLSISEAEEKAALDALLGTSSGLGSSDDE
eukprot:gb/GFBE01083487.1/.p1 GENE.gb/GFBE01083487.1/~~gb/GFBE01083487.1/.p1  ORF type:complete len:216 (+),score=51.02 gb/GFBE01083487.1/:1-648(+)